MPDFLRTLSADLLTDNHGAFLVTLDALDPGWVDNVSEDMTWNVWPSPFLIPDYLIALDGSMLITVAGQLLLVVQTDNVLVTTEGDVITSNSGEQLQFT